MWTDKRGASMGKRSAIGGDVPDKIRRPVCEGGTEISELSHMGKRCMLADACKTAEKYNLELDLLQAWDKTDLPANVQKQLKMAQEEALLERLKQKKIHAVFAKQSEGDKCDRKAPYKWLKSGYLRPQTVCTIIAAQAGVTRTAAYCARVLRQ